MSCLICGKKFDERVIMNHVTLTPNCKCGRLRKRERDRGCINPDCDGKMIDLTLLFGEYTAKCRKCGREWWVREDVI